VCANKKCNLITLGGVNEVVLIVLTSSLTISYEISMGFILVFVCSSYGIQSLNSLFYYFKNA
jgi:hypothetical protein